MHYLWVPDLQATEMVEEDSAASSGKDYDKKKGNSAATARTKKQSKKKKNIKTVLKPMTRKRASTRMIVSVIPSSTTIIVSLIQFTIGKLPEPVVG